MKKHDVKDLVARTEAALQEAQEAVAANRKERVGREAEGSRLLDEIGRDCDGSVSEKQRSRRSWCEARVAHLDKELPTLELAATEAGAALTLARKQAAEAEQAGFIADKARLNERITETTRELGRLLEEAEAVQGRIDQLAEDYGLARPRGRLLLPRELIRSQGAEVLRNALDQVRVHGLRQT